MKKLLAILLAAVLLLGMIPMAGAAFTDESTISAEHLQAVKYISEKGVISGFPDGSFKPAETLTRAQAAKILCVALEGADKADKLTKTDTGFADVPASHWAAKYVAYCAEKEIVSGVGGGKFNPDAPLTAAAFGKMLLVAYGRAKAGDLVGKDWVVNTQKAMRTDNMKEGLDNVGDTPTTRENACHMAYNFMLENEIATAEPEAYKTTTITLTEAGKYRLLGRAQQTADGVVCDCSADGVEFTIECKGKIAIKANSSWMGTNNIAYRVIVDGVPADQVKVTAAKKDFDLVAWQRVGPGLDTIRIVKDFEITQSLDLLKSVTLTCKPDTMQPTQPKEKLLVSIGDSTSAGFGIIPTDTPNTTRNSASAILTYSYLTAQALDMDVEMVVKGSGGIVKKYANGDGRPCDERELYEFQNPYRDENTHYAFPRKADAVILKLSNNDNGQKPEDVEAALVDIIANIRRHNGDDIPIALIYFSSYKHAAIAEKYINSDPKIIYVKAMWDGKGMGAHTSGATHVVMAERLVEGLKPLLGMN